MMSDITWLLTTISLTGSFLNARKKIACFYLWVIGEVCWLSLDLSQGVFGRAFLDLTQLIFALYGIYEWRKLDGKNKVRQTGKRDT